MVDTVSAGKVCTAQLRLNTPPVNHRKIAAIRRKLAAGNYQLDEDAIAAAMLRFAGKPLHEKLPHPYS